ncbi:TPA: hypothetical protein VBX25_002060 [Streptococcus agalactiae]|nr:hypothetical protein [Streptococcus agalactiae]
MIPKFRAWDKHSQKMFTNSELVIWNGNVYANDSKKLTCNNLKGWSIDDEYLMQSTGMFDKNGIEIWEGDIVLTTRLIDYTYKNFKGVVKMLEGRWLIDTGTDAVYLWSEIEENEVVGNVYQNSD